MYHENRIINNLYTAVIEHLCIVIAKRIVQDFLGSYFAVLKKKKERKIERSKKSSSQIILLEVIGMGCFFFFSNHFWLSWKVFELLRKFLILEKVCKEYSSRMFCLNFSRGKTKLTWSIHLLLLISFKCCVLPFNGSIFNFGPLTSWTLKKNKHLIMGRGKFSMCGPALRLSMRNQLWSNYFLNKWSLTGLVKG